MPDAAEIAARFEHVFAAIRDTRMQDVPILNAAMPVKAVGFREWGAYWLGVLITPWFMNLVLAPHTDTDAEGAWSDLRVTDTVKHSFPAGEYAFLVGEEDGVGRYQMCSLFSPMFEFEDAEAAVLTAEAVMVALFEAEAKPEAPQEQPKAVSRRAFLTGARGDKVAGEK